MVNVNNVNMLYTLRKGYRDFILRPLKQSKVVLALQNVNLVIEHGDKVAFMGVNGAGKTTLLKLIGGLLYPSAGNINVKGFDTVSNNLRARKSVGFALNEERSFYLRLTGYQNLEFFGSLDNLWGTDLKNKILKLLYMVGLEKAANKDVATYSSGMKQRLAIARSLLSDPSVLILDEPTRTLDPGGAEEIRQLISKRLHLDSEKTLLIASHRFEEVQSLCNKICVLDKGKIAAFSTLSDVQRQYNSIADFYRYTLNQSDKVNSNVDSL